MGDEKPLEIAEAARAHAERLAAALPEGVRVATWGTRPRSSAIASTCSCATATSASGSCC
ncbi:MAG: hypothetical protein M5U28_26285 [Sandaracinaceae bacterium]|nr:hypothetical protein [Sandaracinaceae bacterium]